MVTACLLLLALGALHLNSGGFNQRDTFSSLFEHYSFTSQSQPVTHRKVCAQLFLTFNINQLSIWGWTCAVNHWGKLWILTKRITLSFKQMSYPDLILTKMFGGCVSSLCICGCFCVVYVCAPWCVRTHSNLIALANTERIIVIHTTEIYISSPQLLSHVRLFTTPWTIAHQASLLLAHRNSLLEFKVHIWESPTCDCGVPHSAFKSREETVSPKLGFPYVCYFAEPVLTRWDPQVIDFF